MRKLGWIGRLFKSAPSDVAPAPTDHYQEHLDKPVQKKRDMSSRMLPLFGACPYMPSSGRRPKK